MKPMREIKRGDKVVCINPDAGSRGKVLTVERLRGNWIHHTSGVSGSRDYCHAPPTNHKYKIGDWVLPVTDLEEEQLPWLLKPFKITDCDDLCVLGLDAPFFAHKKIVPIHRTPEGYEINGTLLSVKEFHSRYGVEIPLEEKLFSERCAGRWGIPVNPERTPLPPWLLDPDEQNKQTDSNNWPTPKDIEECCAKYKHEDSNDTYTIYPESLSNWKSREHFDSEIVKMCGKKVPGENIPPQCVPRDWYIVMPRPKWTDEAVRRYPRVTEWD